MKNYKMNFIELQVTFALCILFFLRMLGMFMIIPVLSHYSFFLKGSNNFLISLAMGIYGVSQIIFQIPFGIFSDIYNRKKMIIFGLFLFFFGNIVTLFFHSIWGLIVGRFIQGSGAISGVLMALLSDLIREKNQKKATIFIGISFACSFLLAMIIGPLLSQKFGFFSIFLVSSFLSIICIYIVFNFIPDVSLNIKKYNIEIFNKECYSYVFSKQFIRYYISIFFIHFFFMANFMIIPKKLELSGLPLNSHWQLYLITILISFFIASILKINYIKNHMIELCIILFFISNIIFLQKSNNLICLIFALQIFFIAFNFLEVFLPSSLSKKILKPYKGSVMSCYSTCQFLGVFLGGLFNSICFLYLNVYAICFLYSFCIFLWLIMSILLKNNFL